MLVALAVIVEVVAMRMQDVEVGLRTGKGDVEQSPLLFDFGIGFSGQIGRMLYDKPDYCGATHYPPQAG